MCDNSPLRRPGPGQRRGARDRLRADELTEFAAGSAGIVRMPEDATSRRPPPVIVVCPERYGLVQHTVDVTERFASGGWAAVSPDFYADVDETEAGRLPPVPDDSVVAHIKAALGYVGDDPRCDSERVVIFGVCRSGSWGLVAGAQLAEVRGVIMLYGGAGPREYVTSGQRPGDYRAMIRASDAPVLGIFGEADHTMSVDDVTELRNAFEDARRSYEITVVPDMPHGWINDTMPGRFRAEAAEQTWTQMLGFLQTIASSTGDPRPRVTWEFRATIAADYDFASNVRLE